MGSFILRTLIGVALVCGIAFVSCRRPKRQPEQPGGNQMKLT